MMTKRAKFDVNAKELARIKRFPIYGNHKYDWPIFKALDSYMKSSASIKQRAEALRYVSEKVMGVPVASETTDTQLVQQYMIQIEPTAVNL